jgi:hypothetical protein
MSQGHGKYSLLQSQTKTATDIPSHNFSLWLCEIGPLPDSGSIRELDHLKLFFPSHVLRHPIFSICDNLVFFQAYETFAVWEFSKQKLRTWR